VLFAYFVYSDTSAQWVKDVCFLFVRNCTVQEDIILNAAIFNKTEGSYLTRNHSSHPDIYLRNVSIKVQNLTFESIELSVIGPIRPINYKCLITFEHRNLYI
jgi:hypothetical protein